MSARLSRARRSTQHRRANRAGCGRRRARCASGLIETSDGAVGDDGEQRDHELGAVAEHDRRRRSPGPHAAREIAGEALAAVEQLGARRPRPSSKMISGLPCRGGSDGTNRWSISVCASPTPLQGGARRRGASPRSAHAARPLAKPYLCSAVADDDLPSVDGLEAEDAAAVPRPPAGQIRVVSACPGCEQERTREARGEAASAGASRRRSTVATTARPRTPSCTCPCTMIAGKPIDRATSSSSV